ncbi:hypothetical protein NUW54_g8731 [Trametes sanguinea]|uniref:Uncharacterized protein n=1 Tax=Trametes sanguinea TaxID=158606 RepID=A0ACC1PB75_9APHY|nr:hypothetical protein NUW54_g8731 [Trametes sanguinea]
MPRHANSRRPLPDDAGSRLATAHHATAFSISPSCDSLWESPSIPLPIQPAPTDQSEQHRSALLAQMTELQNNYEDLREKYVERTEELTRLRNELAEKQRSSGGRLGGTAKYEEIVGPVIEEYEKTIAAMEAELKLNRAALRHTNDLYDEKENEYNALVERHTTTEMYVEELKGRLAKVVERERATEAYVHDLEEKVRQYDESQMSSSDSITDLKRELSRYKETETASSLYITELETRLAKADESVLALRETVEKLEKECEKRQQQVETLEARLEALKQDGESWRSDLEQREARVRELEQKMQEWEAKRLAAGEERERLGDLVNEVAKAKQELEVPSPVKTNGATTNSANSEVSSINEVDGTLETQLVALQQTHTATLADLSAVTAKYRDALREIADLAAQLQEAKVNAPVPPAESPERAGELSPKRRMQRGIVRDGQDSPNGANGAGRRLFYRNAASSESLHSRSLSQSVSLSQELSSARSRKASTSSHGTSSSISQSPGHSRPNLSISLPSVAVSPTERSVASYEEEIMRLQDVLKEREAEIAALEIRVKNETNGYGDSLAAELQRSPSETNGNEFVHLSPKTINHFSEIRKSLDLHHANQYTVSDVDESLVRLNELMRSMAQKESHHKEVVDDLTNQLTQVRKQHEELQVLSRDQTLNMSMELEALRKKHEEDLLNHAQDLKELESFQEREQALLKTLDEAKQRETELQSTLENLSQREMELIDSLQKAEESHAAEVEQLKAAHEDAIRAKEAELNALVAELKKEHEASVSELRAQVAESSAALEAAHRDHEEAFGKLKAEHEEELRRRLDEANAALEQARADHEATIAKTSSEHQAALDALKAEHASALSHLESTHQEELQRRVKEATDALEKAQAEHAERLRRPLPSTRML